jgi:excisionase family DNA binding protein
MARIGEIPAFKLGKDWRFHKEALRRWMEGQHLGKSGRPKVR